MKKKKNSFTEKKHELPPEKFAKVDPF